MKPLAKVTHGKLQQSIRSHHTLRIESWKGVKEGIGRQGNAGDEVLKLEVVY